MANDFESVQYNFNHELIIVLVINNLCKTYPNGIHALHGVSIEISTGIFGLLGPNGAGKSTLMRTLATLQTADSGEVSLAGTDLLANPQWIRERLGYLPQDFGVYPQASAEDFLDQLAVYKGFTNRRQRKEMVADRLQQVNLYERRKQKLGTFSGGMRQRIGIAQALLGDPQLVIVDEPTAGLDPTERIRFQNLLADLGQDRVLILSTHIVEDVADLCQNLAIMNQGEIVAVGDPLQLVAELEGKVWTRTAQDEADELLPVITCRMIRGKRQLRVFSEEAPGSDYQPAQADLNDVYFMSLQGKQESLSV